MRRPPPCLPGIRRRGRRHRARRSVNPPPRGPIAEARGYREGSYSTILQRNAPEEPPCAAAVGLDLGPQRVDIGERAFVPQALDERQAERRVVEISIQVENVGF